MAISTIEAVRAVTGGVDTHGDVHVAAVLDPVGGVLGTQAFDATPAGYRQLLEWLRGFGAVSTVGVEGTGAYGCGLANFLRRQGVGVVEVDRPNRQARRKQGKSDPLDAVEAARAALSGRAGSAKTKDGAVEAIRVLIVARRSASQARVKALVQMRHLVYTAPDQLRERLKGLSTHQLLVAAAGLGARPAADPVVAATTTALRSLAGRVRTFDAEIKAIDELLGPLVVATAVELVGLTGVGPVVAATLLVAAGDNPERLRSEAAWARLCGVAPLPASSGKVTRHRLDRGGNRQANNALWRIVIVRLTCDPKTQAYVERRLKEGRTKREVIRVLKRYVALEVYRHLPRR
jgi:transposase